MFEDSLKSPLSGRDPSAYLEAPALMITSRNSGEPLAVEQSVAAVQQYQSMTPRDLNIVQRELSILTGRLEEVEQQLGVERKMGEAASILGKLHSNSGETNKRKSIFKSNSKRLSRQADEEAQVSKDRVVRLEFARTELTSRKYGLENRLLRHHAAVLCKALSGEPLNPRPLSVAINGSAPVFDTPERSPRRMSRTSQFDFTRDFANSDIPSVAPLHSHSRNASLSTLGGSYASNHASPGHGTPTFTHHNTFDSEAQQELNGIAKRIEGALPTVTPNPNKGAFIISAFDSLLREQQKSEKVIETLQHQAHQAEQRIAYLAKQDRAVQAPTTTSPESARLEAENQRLGGELDQERKRARELRDRVEAQRIELQRVTKELEDVTRIAVQSESQLRECETIIEQLERQTQEQSVQIADGLGSTLSSATPSILCKEFRQIIHDLTQKHYNEQRALRDRKITHQQVPT